MTTDPENCGRSRFGFIPIGTIRTPFSRPPGTPIQPSEAAGVRAQVDVAPEFEEGLQDLAGFDRIWLLYWMDHAPAMRLRVRPFLDDSEHGLFATRAPCRPNPIGLSCVRLVEVRRTSLVVEDVDILDETPLLDIKPYVVRFDSYPVQRCGWLDSTIPHSGLADGRFAEGTNGSLEAHT